MPPNLIRYFAYGSNMSSERLTARVGSVQDRGRAQAYGWRHCFNKRGADGTAKGNIVTAHPRSVVHGVVYELDDAQWAALVGYEGGYHTIAIEVRGAQWLEQVAVLPAGGVTVRTFTALTPIAGLAPTAEYLRHYARGMSEHDINSDYRARILASANEAAPPPVVEDTGSG